MEQETPEKIIGWSDLPAQPLPSKEATLLVTAKLQIQDLQEQVKRLRREQDILEQAYTDSLKSEQRAVSLLEEYAVGPNEKRRRKLDRKLGIFFPTIMRMVYERRQKN